VGTHKAKGPELVKAVQWALQAGYRHIGTPSLTSLSGLLVTFQLGALLQVCLLADGRRPAHTPGL
jgi:hypothetical protein